MWTRDGRTGSYLDARRAVGSATGYALRFSDRARTLSAEGMGNVAQQVGMASNLRQFARRFLLVMSSDELVMSSGMRNWPISQYFFGNFPEFTHRASSL